VAVVLCGEGAGGGAEVMRKGRGSGHVSSLVGELQGAEDLGEADSVVLGVGDTEKDAVSEGVAVPNRRLNTSSGCVSG